MHAHREFCGGSELMQVLPPTRSRKNVYSGETTPRARYFDVAQTESGLHELHVFSQPCRGQDLHKFRSSADGRIAHAAKLGRGRGVSHNDAP